MTCSKNGKHDKAIWYLNKLIEVLEGDFAKLNKIGKVDVQ